mgnify:CR=1 FL=1
MNLVPPEFAYAITSRGYKDPVRIFEQGDESLYQVCRYSEHSTPRLEVVGYEKRHHLAFANDCQIYSITMEYSPHVKLNFTACKKAPNYGTFAIEKRVKGTKLPLIDDLVLFVHFEDPKQNPLKFFLHRWANRSLDRARLPTFVTFVPIGTEGTEAPNEGSGEHSPTEDPQEAHDQPFASDEWSQSESNQDYHHVTSDDWSQSECSDQQVPFVWPPFANNQAFCQQTTYDEWSQSESNQASQPDSDFNSEDSFRSPFDDRQLFLDF